MKRSPLSPHPDAYPEGDNPPPLDTRGDASGRLVAEDAHAAGVVVPPVELPMHTVTLEFRVHGTVERAGRIADELATAAAFYDGVQGAVSVGVTTH